jgi:hypothetical protein
MAVNPLAAAAVATTMILLTAPEPFRSTTWGKDLAPGQYDVDGQLGPRRSPNVVIEEPRPSTTVLETEGRGENRDCRSAVAGDSAASAKITSPDQPCDR